MTADTIAQPTETAKPRRARAKTGDPRADRAAQRTAPAKPEIDAQQPETPQPAADPAAKPLTVNACKKVVAEKLIAAAADLAANWEHSEITRDEATALLGAWLNYLPGGVWDDRLGQRSGAGKSTAKS